MVSCVSWLMLCFSMVNLKSVGKNIAMPNKEKIPLRVLILEDRSEDAELMLYELRKAGFKMDARRVEDEAGFRARLDVDVDIILADYALPGYNALNALASLQESGLDIPFIIVTGALSDEDAAACIKRGADDYLRKDRLARLAHAVAIALDQKHLRAEHRAAEQALRVSEQKYLCSSTKSAIRSLSWKFRPSVALGVLSRLMMRLACDWAIRAKLC